MSAPRLPSLLLAGLLSACAGARQLVVPWRGDAPPALISGARVFDGEGEALSEPLDVLLDGGRIRSIGPVGSVPAPEAALRVDATGQTLIPGLVDCHTHIGGAEGGPFWSIELPKPREHVQAYPFAGVTAVLNAAHDTDLEALEEQIASGTLAGPWMFRSTRIVTAVGGHPVTMYRAVLPWPLWPMVAADRVQEVGSAEEASEAVARDLRALRSDFVKVVYAQLPPGSPKLTVQQLRSAIAEAHRRHRRVVVHVSASEDAVTAAEAGADVLMHTPWEDVLGDEQVQRLVSTGVSIVTTLRGMSVTDALVHGRVELSELDRAVMMPVTEKAFAERPERIELVGFPEGYERRFAEYDRHLVENVKKLHAAGARLLAGSDSGISGVFHGSGLHRELESLVAAGLPPAAVLKMATSAPARVLAPHEHFGVVRVGARADLVLVEGDPLADIRNTQKIVGVWQSGHRLERK